MIAGLEVFKMHD